LSTDSISTSNSPKTPAFAASDLVILGQRCRSDSLQSDIPEPESPNSPLEGGIASISRCTSTSPSTALELAIDGSSKTRCITTIDVSREKTADHNVPANTAHNSASGKKALTPVSDIKTSLHERKKIRTEERLSVSSLQLQTKVLQIEPKHVDNGNHDESENNDKKSDRSVTKDYRSTYTQPRKTNRLLDLLTPTAKVISVSTEGEKKPDGLSKTQGRGGGGGGGGGAVRMLSKALSAITKKK
jgi:hypothetical protein